MTLYEVERHEPLTSDCWDEGRARSTIAQIVEDAHRCFTPEGLWPIHPLDRSPERPPDSLKTLYYGAAGVIWALHYLDEAGAAHLRRDYLAAAGDLAGRHRDDLAKYPEVARYMGQELGSSMMGVPGMLFVNWRLAPSEELAGKLYKAIEARIGDVRGLVWGSAGLMLLALFMLHKTNEPRWKELFLRHCDALWEQWRYAEDQRCHLWTIDLYGNVEKRLGALHGFLANVSPLIRARLLLPSDRQAELLSRIHEVLEATASSKDSRINWPVSPGQTPRFVQHCNGAPGVINCLAGFLDDPDTNSLLTGAGELIWDAGPLVKMPVLCHGTPGNGYAFLKLYALSGDERWLSRARSFAMHAIEQSEHALAQHRQRKYSLWTGDLGLAIYLWDCVRGTAGFPTLDVF